jgi:hypothetical protein
VFRTLVDSKKNLILPNRPIYFNALEPPAGIRRVITDLTACMILDMGPKRKKPISYTNPDQNAVYAECYNSMTFR